MPESARLAALRRYRILDTEPEEAFDRIVHLARALFDMPVALVSLIDERRQWFKARAGIAVTETPRSWAFCNHAIQQTDPMIVRDARSDPRFADNPLVMGSPYVRFYAGAPIRAPNHEAIGTVCVLSPDPDMPFSAIDEGRLASLAGIVSHELELRLAVRRSERYAANLEILCGEIHNQVANSLQLIADVLEFQIATARDASATVALKNALGRIGAVGRVHRQLRQQSSNEIGDTKSYVGSLLRTLWLGLAPNAEDRRIEVDIPDQLMLSTDLLPRLGMAATELAIRSLNLGRGSVRFAIAPAPGGIVLSVEVDGWLPTTDAAMQGWTDFRLIEMLAGDDAVSIDPARPGWVSVHMRS